MQQPDGSIVLVLQPDEVVDAESRNVFASRIIDAVCQLTEPSSAGFAFTNHQKLELSKMLVRYQADMTLLKAFGSKVPEEAAIQVASIAARIELLNYLVSTK